MNTTGSIPTRSWLFRVDLLGRGSGQVESLTSYIARVASTHFLRPSGLLHRGLEWLDIGEPENVGKWKRKSTNLHLKPALNAHSGAIRWTKILENQGVVTNLAEATLSSWGSLFPKRGILKRFHAWCPHCLSEAQAYDRLLWTLGPVKVCPIHRCQLVDQCPSCHSRIPTIHSRSAPGKCPRCDAHLSQERPALDSYSDSYELWSASELQSFIGSCNLRSAPLVRAGIDNVLSECMTAANITDSGALGRILGVSRITAWYWCMGKAVPDLANTLRIAHAFGLSLEAIVQGKIPVRLNTCADRSARWGENRRLRRNFDVSAVLGQINQFRLDRATTEPPSLADVSRFVGFDPRLLRVHFPDICREISLQHRKACRDKVAARRTEMRESLRLALQQSRLERFHPSRREIGAKLQRPGLLRNAGARKMLDQLELELI